MNRGARPAGQFAMSEGIACDSPAVPNVGATSKVQFSVGKYWRYNIRNTELAAICFTSEPDAVVGPG